MAYTNPKMKKSRKSRVVKGQSSLDNSMETKILREIKEFNLTPYAIEMIVNRGMSEKEIETDICPLYIAEYIRNNLEIAEISGTADMPIVEVPPNKPFVKMIPIESELAYLYMASNRKLLDSLTTEEE